MRLHEEAGVVGGATDDVAGATGSTILAALRVSSLSLVRGRREPIPWRKVPLAHPAVDTSVAGGGDEAARGHREERERKELPH